MDEYGSSSERIAAPFMSVGPAQSPLSRMVSVLSAADELSACHDTTAMLRLATETARERLGLERVGLYIRDRSAHRVLRGTWGTGARGEITDERSLFHEIAPRDYDALLNVRLGSGLGMYQACAPLIASEQGRTFVIGKGWIMATPLVAGRDVVGIMYNDSAFTLTPMDEGKQGVATVFCTVLALLLLSRRGKIAWEPLPRRSGQSPLVQRVLRTLKDEIPITGERLARELGVSAGHLARSFKREMAMSLVDYRNRLRLSRFFEAVQRKGDAGTLLDAALEAGFGSYPQFHRVYRKFQGGSPRDLFAQGWDTPDPSD